jgi:hypothetical protein
MDLQQVLCEYQAIKGGELAMAKINKKTLSTGIFLAVTFLGVLVLIFSPIFGQGRNGLQYSDDMFNKLSKGSSYFIPKVAKSNDKFKGANFEVAIKLDKPEQNTGALKMLAVAGAGARTASPEIQIRGDLGAFLSNIIQDADDMYKNDGKKVSERYGVDEQEVLSTWWNILKGMDKSLKKLGKIKESQIVSDVMRKTVEPAFNYYKIEAHQVADRAWIMTGLLVFYVVYTMWWGFAIFYIFDGIGLTMKKARIKKEV